MISNSAIVFMIFQVLISLAIPIGLIIYFIRKYKISWKPMLVGMLVFIVFSQVLEAILHVYVLTLNAYTQELLDHPLWFALYGAFAAGIFEEVGRYVGFRFLLKKCRRWKDGIAYGLGHGGIEAIILGALSAISVLILAFMINTGAFDSLMQQMGANGDEALRMTKQQLTDTPAYEYLLGGLERVFALTIQLGLSLLVLYGIKKGKLIFLLYAILAHAMVDLLPALSQKIEIHLFLVEGYVFIMAILSLIFIIQSKKRFDE